MSEQAARPGTATKSARGRFETCLHDAVQRARRLVDQPGAKRAAAIMRSAFFIGVLALLLHSLAKIGWNEVVASLPDNPLFYVIFAIRYVLQPLTEIPVYAISWRMPMRRHWRAFLRKRVYNAAVLGYSGEAYFSLWARRTLGISDKAILVALKDNNLASAFVSNAVTALAITALMLNGEVRSAIADAPGAAAIFATAFASAAALSVAFLSLRKRVIGLNSLDLRRVLAVNLVRIAIVISLHALLYDAAIAGQPMSAWFVFIALQLALTRIPFLPNQDVLFLTLALGLSGLVGAPEAAIAAMLLAEAFLTLLSHIASFLLTAGQRVR
jgi:hypothetical protein